MSYEKQYNRYINCRELNKKLGNTQFRVPKVETLEQAYEVILIHFYQYIYVKKSMNLYIYLKLK